MHEKTLKQFLDQNAPDYNGGVPSAAAICHFLLGILTSPDSEEIRKVMDETVAEAMPGRLEEVAESKAEIEAITSGSDLVRTMRRKVDPLNHSVLVKKAKTLENEVIPEVIRRLKNNTTDQFIELAAQVLATCTLDIADEIMGYFNEMRSPYAQSVALIMLGFKANEEHIPWFIDKYHELKKKHPHERFYEGAYYGLRQLEGRFYL